MHSKYDCMLDAILNHTKLRPTKTYAWIDISYFRTLATSGNYCMALPANYTDDRVMFSEVSNTYMLGVCVWVVGVVWFILSSDLFINSYVLSPFIRL